MKVFVLILFLVAAAGVAPAQNLAPEQLAAIGFEQNLGASVPLDIPLRDEAGQPVRLAEFFQKRPVILALAYYECPNLCTLVLNGLLDGVKSLKLEPGKDFEIVVLSINPGESPALAAAKKQTYTQRYGRSGERGWHFLTGDAEPIRQLSDAVGFHYVYEPSSRQFAHASGIVVLSATGKISRYFLGINYPAGHLRLALVEASENRVGTLADRLLLLCFHYNPVTGRYGLIIQRVIQGAGLLTVLLVGAAIVHFKRQERTKERG